MFLDYCSIKNRIEKFFLIVKKKRRIQLKIRLYITTAIIPFEALFLNIQLFELHYFIVFNSSTATGNPAAVLLCTFPRE